MKNVTEKQKERLAEMFKAMGETSRLVILDILHEQPRCVTEIAEITKLSQSLASHHLRILRTSDVVKQTKQGRKVIYSLYDDHVSQIFELSVEHASHM